MKTTARDGSESHPYQSRSYRDVIGRRALPHDPPLSLDPAQEIFFITICCKQRRTNQLCYSEVASILFEAARFYEREQKWFVHVMVLMPDHVHFLVNFGLDATMTDLPLAGSDSHRGAQEFSGSAISSIIAYVETKVGAKKAIIFCRILFVQEWSVTRKIGPLSCLQNGKDCLR
jgi:Transposase IS200 like